MAQYYEKSVPQNLKHCETEKEVADKSLKDEHNGGETLLEREEL